MEPLLCALSVDLDEIDCYRRIHGLPRRERGATAVYDVALERVAAFAAAHRLPLSLFAVGEDLQRPAAARRLGDVARAGHEVENHSFRHRYDLSRLPPARIRDDVDRAHRLIEHLMGRAPTGFRAPGYTLSDSLLEAIDAQGYAFDSSVFPCPAYYAAKALALGAHWLGRRRSAAVLDTPRVALAPRLPYRPGRPWHRRGGHGILELPIQVTPRVRFPVIGTSLVLAGAWMARALVRRCLATGFVNLELHGIDFLGRDDGIGDLAPVQPDVRVPVDRKRAVLDAVVAELRTAGARFVTLADAAKRLAPHSS